MDEEKKEKERKQIIKDGMLFSELGAESCLENLSLALHSSTILVAQQLL